MEDRPIEQATAAPGEKRDIGMSTSFQEEINLGVASWDSSVGGYVLRCTRIYDLPLSFNIYTKLIRG